MGSNPIARSAFLIGLLIVLTQSAFFVNTRCIRALHGDVAKWEGKGLQNPHHGFKSRRRLIKKTSQSGSFLLLW